MYREMRRKDRQVSTEAAVNLLQKGEYGVLATSGEDKTVYAVPLSYVNFDNCIYFHCAKTGHKLDNIMANPKVSFCVVGATKVLPEKFSTTYESAVVFGTAEIVEDKPEKANALRALVAKYSPGFAMQGEEYLNKDFDITTVVRINIEHITGKQRGE